MNTNDDRIGPEKAGCKKTTFFERLNTLSVIYLSPIRSWRGSVRLSSMNEAIIDHFYVYSPSRLISNEVSLLYIPTLSLLE
jgi:hypothetical protein